MSFSVKKISTISFFRKDNSINWYDYLKTNGNGANKRGIVYLSSVKGTYY